MTISHEFAITCNTTTAAFRHGMCARTLKLFQEVTMHANLCLPWFTSDVRLAHIPHLNTA